MPRTASFSVGLVNFDARSGELRLSQRTRRLELKAAAVLRILCEHEGALFSRQELLDGAWGEGRGSDEALTQAVAQIRRAFEDLGERDPIETLARRGYRINRQPSLADSRSRAPKWKRFILPAAAIAVGACLILVLASPHGVRHSVRHALGLGPSAASAASH